MRYIAAIFVIALLATISLGSPPELAQRPLPGGSAPAAAFRPLADEPGAEQAFYYNGSTKIFLNDSGRAIVKLNRANAPVPEQFKPLWMALDGNDPMAELAESLKKSGVVIIRTDAPNGLHSLTAKDRPENVEYVLPIVFEDLGPARNEPIVQSEDPMFMTNTISVRFSNNAVGPRDEGQRQRVEEYVRPFELRVKKPQSVPNAYSLELADGPIHYLRLLNAANTLFEKGAPAGHIIYAKPDFIRIKNRKVDIMDERFANQWHLHKACDDPADDVDVDAPEAWSITEGSRAIRVAIIDDSVERGHPDLSGNFLVGRHYDGGADPPTHDDDPSPRSASQGHGTACAGIAVGTADRTGIRGVAPGCGLIGVHFWAATDSQIAEAFYFCDDPDRNPDTVDGAAVISCSWTLKISPPQDLVVAIDDLAKTGRGGSGSVVLFAAGNDNDFIRRRQKLARDSVICVGAVNDAGERSWYSNFGPELTVVAPSSGTSNLNLRIDTTDNSDSGNPISGYASGLYTGTGSTGFGGTSASTPLTAGICALMLSVNPKLTRTQVCSIVQHTCDRIRGGKTYPAKYDPTTGHDSNYGYGRINAKNALLATIAATHDPDLIWPDIVRNLQVSRDGGASRVSVDELGGDVRGVLVVRGTSPVRWRPRDGERYVIGETVDGVSATVVSLNTSRNWQFPESGGDHIALYSFTAEYRYSWGVAASLALTPQTDSSVAATEKDALIPPGVQKASIVQPADTPVAPAAEKARPNRFNRPLPARSTKILPVLILTKTVPGLEDDRTSIVNMLKAGKNQVNQGLAQKDQVELKAPLVIEVNPEEHTWTQIIAKVDRFIIDEPTTLFFYAKLHGKIRPAEAGMPGEHILSLDGDTPDHFLPRSALRDRLLTSPARLIIFVTDSCANDLQTGKKPLPGIRRKPVHKRVFEDLFLKPSGLVDINSCTYRGKTGEILNEKAWVLPSGGLFTRTFTDLLDRGELEPLDANHDGTVYWSELLRETQKRTNDNFKFIFGDSLPQKTQTPIDLSELPN